jgi:ribonuclease H / adenosylcobalamin/alpha-ribazole phosphatase
VVYFGVKLYIIRHGSTQHLENKQRQTNDSTLSQQGLIQVDKVAQRLVNFDIDLFFASPIKRTKQTADAISKSTGIKHMPDERLREIDHPEKLYGAGFADEIVKKYDREKLSLLDDIDWKFLSGGESLRDVISRMADFKNEMTKKYIDKNILTVSHAYAIRCLVASCILGDDYQDRVMLKLFHAIRISKASLSILEYKPENKYFYVHLLNDVTHLGGQG